MATWKKYFTTVPSQVRMTAKLEQMNRETTKAGTSHKFSSYLPEVYAGAPNRIERYVAYDQADLDSEINRALDTIAEFCTQNQDDDNPIPFRIIYRGDVTETETELLTDALQQWSSINKFNQRIFKIFRNSIKYGDQFFVRDPETYELLWVDATKVEKIMVNEAEGKKIDQYVIKDLDFNMESMVATNPLVHDQYSFPGGYPRSSNPASGSGTINYGQPSTPGSRTSRFYNPASSTPVDAAHVVHLSLTDGMDQNWPFGISILEAVYKTYKQKDLLEDCILIYRIVRAPERRVFYIDVGQLQGQRAMQYVERVKNEIYQRRMPNRTGGGASIVDTSYNPISMTEDFFLATNNEQRGTKIENLAGGENLGCFSLDTKIKLLDGRDLSISDIEQEMLTGKQLWTFSCHPVTGEIAPGKITWAGKTRSDAQVLRLTLDSGETITCTPDHKFPIRGVGFVEAKDLTIGQSLTALYTKKEPIKSKLEYEMFYNHVNNKWEFVHRMVASFMKSSGEKNSWVYKPEFANSKMNVVHHVDHDRFNNTPENLVYMNWTDHRIYHQENGFTAEQQKMGTIAARKKIEKMRATDPANYDSYIAKQVAGRAVWRNNLSSDDRVELITKLRNGLANYFVNKITDEEKIAMSVRNSIKAKKGGQRNKYLLENDPLYRSKFSSSVKAAQLLRKNNSPEKWLAQKAAMSEANYKKWSSGKMSHVHDEQRFKYTPIMLQKITDMYNLGNNKLQDIVDMMNNDLEFVDHWKSINNTSHNKIKFSGFGVRHVYSILNNFGLDWDKFRVINTSVKHNSDDAEFEKIMKYVNISKNQLEFVKLSNISRHNMLKITSKYNLTDYNLVKAYADIMNHRVVNIEYLSEPMDVGTLTVDGDEEYHDYHTYALSVGVFVKNSLDDLHYFNNKLLRGLGIPSSYLPSGPEDGTVSYNDGKIGTAFIQEYRFNKYCQRLQNHFAPTFDLEFKLFLKNRGIEVHSSLFELAFNVPQSFSEYRQMALDSERANLFSQVMSSDAAKYMSKRFALEKYLGLTQEELLENEKLWKEENSDKVKAKTGVAPAENGGVGLGSIGIRPDSGPDFGDEMPSDEDMSTGGEESTAETPDIGGAGGPAPAPETPPQSP